MKYKFEIKEGDYGYKKIILSDKIKLAEYVFEDMECFCRPIFSNAIERVLTMESNFEEISGNMCSLQISKDITVISSEFVQDDMQNECSIETVELFELINTWIRINFNKIN